MAAKAVLHALADHADENGVCWPSIDRIARWAGCNEKTARKALQRVVDMGAVERRARAGRSDVFTLQMDWDPSRIQPLPISTPPKNDPSLNRDPPLPKVAGDPSLIREDTPPKIGTRTVKEPSKNRQGTTNERATRLPENWQPSSDLVGFAESLGVDPAHAAAEFTDYWRGVPGTKGRKLDWDATFRNRCRELASRGGRGGGKSFRPSGRSSEIAALVRGASRVGRDEPL